VWHRGFLLYASINSLIVLVMKKSVFLTVMPFVFVGLMMYCLWLQYFGFAIAFLVCTMVMVFIDYGIFINENKKS
jgi:hypothetical protein